VVGEKKEKKKEKNKKNKEKREKEKKDRKKEKRQKERKDSCDLTLLVNCSCWSKNTDVQSIFARSASKHLPKNKLNYH